MFDFQLPEHLIAQHPNAQRDRSRLLVVRRSGGDMEHHTFADLPELLDPGDLLILNDTKVVPARLLGRRERTGGKWEGLYLRTANNGVWQILCQTRGRLQPGEWIAIEPRPLRLQLIDKNDDGSWQALPNCTGAPLETLQKCGHVPLPPYIRKGRAGAPDRQRYQTIYAAQPGAVAAPTAGLHFTSELFQKLCERRIGWSFVTLHVGWGTFQPLEGNDYTQHTMHSECGELPAATVDAIEKCQYRGGRVVAVGTTSVRVLETVAAGGPPRQWSGETDMFIYPPYEFNVVDGLITNFHLPKTTLLLLVSAFGGVELVQRAYQQAVTDEYRFYSYGDAMLIL